MAEARAVSRAAPSDEPLLSRARCGWLCTARGCCRLIQGLLGVLLIACGSVSFGGPGGYTGLFSLGSAYYYPYGGAYSGFADGADGAKAQRLDAELHRLQRPPAQGAMAVGGALLAWAGLGLAAAGLLGRCPAWLLLPEACLDAAAALALVPALLFYYGHLGEAYASPLCQERQRLYRSKGHAGFDCRLHGAEVAAGLLAGGAALACCASAVLALRAFRALVAQQRLPAKRLDDL
uniref:Uncharacterized protein n=2 Tax=Sphaerodactylus townsendi TaxID=933632 RepID=A0ACB8EB49_9SAUR